MFIFLCFKVVSLRVGALLEQQEAVAFGDVQVMHGVPCKLLLVSGKGTLQFSKDREGQKPVSAAVSA